MALCAFGTFVAIRLYPHHLPSPKEHPGYVDTVLQSRALILAGRMSLVFIAAFAILSIAARMWNKEWLSKAGPFEISKAAAHGEEERTILKQKLAKAEARIENLTAVLKKTTEKSDTLARTLLEFIDDEQGATNGGD